jgi:hypothetical protein
MITKWTYGSIHQYVPQVKNYISTNNLRAIDVGASAYNWSYPECKVTLDLCDGFGHAPDEDLTSFKINIDKKPEWTPILDYVELHGKFDFSICSHTLEDLMFPFNGIELLTSISNEGYIAVPSKFDEFSKAGNSYRGHMHHKQLFDIINDRLCLFPKLSFIENDSRSDDISNNGNHECSNLILYWKNDIPTAYFAEGIIYRSETDLASDYFKQLNITTKDDCYGF